jgi:hypothetical protein
MQTQDDLDVAHGYRHQRVLRRPELEARIEGLKGRR